MAKVKKEDAAENSQTARLKSKIADLEMVVKGQEERLQGESRQRADIQQQADKLNLQVVSLTKELTAARAAAIAPPARTAEELLAEVSDQLMNLPDDSGLKRAVFSFLDSLIENYKDGPGAPGRAAVAILDAATNAQDPAYAQLNVLQRQTATSLANMLKGHFRQ